MRQTPCKYACGNRGRLAVLRRTHDFRFPAQPFRAKDMKSRNVAIVLRFVEAYNPFRPASMGFR
jgi:hypothetical protein